MLILDTCALLVEVHPERAPFHCRVVDQRRSNKQQAGENEAPNLPRAQDILSTPSLIDLPLAALPLCIWRFWACLFVCTVKKGHGVLYVH
jgi:hypothetical protein